MQAATAAAELRIDCGLQNGARNIDPNSSERHVGICRNTAHNQNGADQNVLGTNNPRGHNRGARSVCCDGNSGAVSGNEIEGKNYRLGTGDRTGLPGIDSRCQSHTHSLHSTDHPHKQNTPMSPTARKEGGDEASLSKASDEENGVAGTDLEGTGPGHWTLIADPEA